MIRSIAKGSKLILIFILTVIVSASILTYLSINNISNYKELIEKEISEEQRTIAEDVSIKFEKYLLEITSRFSAKTQSDTIVNIEQFKIIDSIKGVNYPLIVDSWGTFLWPHYTHITNKIRKQSSTKVYLENLKKGEKSEFVIKDFIKAKYNYEKSLEASVNDLDSVRIYNSIARLYTKMNKPKKAFIFYSKIISDFPETYNEYGFIYAHYSIMQLFKLVSSSNIGEVQKFVIGYLENLRDNNTSSNQYTLDLLTNISNLVIIVEDKEEVIEGFSELLISLTNKLRILSGYEEIIGSIINHKYNIESLIPLGDFYALKPFQEPSNELFILKKSDDFFTGFVIDLNEVFNSVASIDQYERNTEFEYVVKCQPKNIKGFFSNGYLTTVTEFSPYFEGHVLHISLKNEQVIGEIVLRRKVTYGIGLILLLGAMIMGLIISIQDVKREKKVKKLKADFVSNVTHELKTPLTSINMFAESIFMERVKSKADLKKYSNIIVKESENLKRMISNILEFSRKENNKLEYQIKENNLSEVLLTTMDEMNYWLEINNFDIVTEIEENVFAKFESESLKQAISNLISNAIKYSFTTKKLVVRLLKKNIRVFIEIEDFGIGIPKAELKLIFEKFYRVNSLENDSASGTGLGLTVTRDIIKAQEGDLIVESVLGKGSKFTIILNI